MDKVKVTAENEQFWNDYYTENIPDDIYLRYFKSPLPPYYIEEQGRYQAHRPAVGKHDLVLKDVKEIIDILLHTPKPTNDQEKTKGVLGSMFFFDQYGSLYTSIDDKRASYPDGVMSSGLIGIDLDHTNEIDPKLAVNILEHWDEYVKELPSLYFGYISNSQHGIHLYLKSKRLREVNYVKEAARLTTMFFNAFCKIEGYKVSDFDYYGTKGNSKKQVLLNKIIDTTSLQITQRHDLSYSPIVKYNENAVVYDWNGLDHDYEKFCEVYEVPGVLKAVLNPKREIEAKIRKEGIGDTGIGKINPMVDLSYDQDEEVEFVLDSFTPINHMVDYNFHHHNQRLQAYSDLSHIFKIGSDEFKKHWRYICSRVPLDNGHTFNTYYDGELASYKPKNYRFGALEDFGYEYHRKELSPLDLIIDDDVLEVKDNQWTPEGEDTYLVDTYLSDSIEYMQLIEDSINNYNYLCLKGNTGIGKSVAIAILATKMNAIVTVPFIDLKNNYTEININGVAKRGLEEINSVKDYHGQPCVMTFDRLSYIPIENLTGKVIFVDESHVMFKDRDYRHNLIIAFNNLKKVNAKVVFVSATPIPEMLHVQKTLTFSKERDYVVTTLVHTDNTTRCILDMIKSNDWKKKYNRMLVFANKSARKIKDNLMYKPSSELSIIHRDYTSFGDFQRIKETNKLDSWVTVCTVLAYNGFNFINKNEKVLVISELGEDSTANEIIQQVGRMRNSKVDLRLVYDDPLQSEEEKEFYKRSVEEAVDKLNDMLNGEPDHDKAIEDHIDLLEKRVDKIGNRQRARTRNHRSVTEKKIRSERLQGLDNDIYDKDEGMMYDAIYQANLEIENYVKEHSNMKAIINDLLQEGYFLVNYYNDDEDFSNIVYIKYDSSSCLNFLKRDADKIAKEDLLDEKKSINVTDLGRLKIDNPTELDGMKGMYYNECMDKMISLVNEYNCSVGKVKELIEKVTRRMVNTIHTNLSRIFDIMKYDNDQWKALQDRVDNEITELYKLVERKYGIDYMLRDSYKYDDYFILARDLQHEREHSDELRAKYIDCKNEDEVIDLYVEEYLAMQKDITEKNNANLYDEFVVTNKETNVSKIVYGKKAIAKYIGCSRNIVDKIIEGKSKKYKDWHIELKNANVAA